MVLNAEGSHIGVGSNSAGLGNALDLELLKALRRRARVIATSAKTVNAEQYRLPTRAHLVVFGEHTIAGSKRIRDGMNRLLLVGHAQTKSSIKNAIVMNALPLRSEAIRNALELQEAKIHFEFGINGTQLLKSEIQTFLCTAPQRRIASGFVGSVLSDFSFVTEIELDDLNLSWWERRG